ncbi:MAG: TIGR04283 family arsenosugar biosynthesis glycosyltransferase [Bacteroidota bacterium]
MASVSIIIPTYNEEDYLPRTLARLEQLNPSPYEIIVVDGQSEDSTVSIVNASGAKLISTDKRSRAHQMNLGARSASGDIVCFLHADTLVPKDLINVVSQTLEDQNIALAGFISIMKGEKRTQWFTSFHNYIKTYYAPLLYRPYKCLFKGLRLLFGDQVIFGRRVDFDRVGGFDDDMEIMEEADLCLKMNKLGRIKQIKRTVKSSDRRVAKWGFIKANTIYIYISLMWAFGVPSRQLRNLYKDIR